MSYNVPEEEKPAFNKKVKSSLELLSKDVGRTLGQLKVLKPETLVEAYNKPVQAPVTRDLTPLERYVYEPQPVEEVADLTARVARESMVTPQEEPRVVSNFANQAQAQFGGDMVSITPYEQAVTDIVGAEVDSLRNDAGEIASSPLEVFAKPLDANKIKALGFVDGEGKPTERGKLFFHLKNSGVFNEDGTITEKGQAYLMPRNEIGKQENIKAFKTWYDDYLDEPMQSDSEIFGAVYGFGKNFFGGLYNLYQTKEKLTNPFGLLDIVRKTAAGKQTIAELKTDQIASLEQIVKNFQNIGGYADIIQGLTGRALYEGASVATGVPMQEMKDAAEENLYLARQRQWQANENLRNLEVGEIAKAITGLDGFVKMADEAKATLGEEQFNKRYAGTSAVSEMFLDPANAIPASKAFKVAASAPVASRAIIKAQQTLGKVAQVEQALNKAQTIVEAGNTILRKEAVAVPLAQKLFTDISARAGSNPELLARAQQALDAGRRITAGADEVRAAMPNAIASVDELAAKRASLATRIPEEYAKKVLQTAELGAKIRSAPAKTVGAILERTGSTLTKVDNAVTGFFSERGLDQAYNAALGAAGVVGLAGNPIVGTIGAGAAALKAGKFITEYGKIFKYVGKEMERARSSIPFWKRVGYHTAPKSLGQGLSHTFNIFELGGATSDILRRVGRGIVAAYPSDLFFEYLSDGGDMRPQTMTRAAAESLVIGGSFAAGGGAFMGTNKRMREIAINDEINFRQGLVDTDQKARFEALPPVVRRSLATYSMANPTLNYNFIESGSSGYEPNTNTANININSTNPLKALVAHETLHHTIIKNNMEGGIAAMFLGDTKTNSAGGLFRSKSGKLDPEFEAFTNNYYDRLRAGGMTDAEIKIEYPLEKVAVEYFIEQHSDQYAAMAESGELGAIAARGEVRKKLGSVLETILPKIPVLRDLHFKSGGAIDANGAFVKGVGILGDDGLRQNPIANRMFKEMNRRSSGMMPGQFEPLLSDKEGSGAPLFFDPANEIDMELLHPLIQVDANDKPILKNGRPIALSKEVDMNRAIAGLSIVEAYRNLKDNNYAPEKGEAYVDDDGEFQPGWISDRVLTQMFAKHPFNNEQKRMIRQTNKMVKEGTGQRMVMINFPATTRNKAGKVVYKTQGATIRDTVPVAVTISKDGNILYGLMSVTKLQENIKKRANERRGKKLYGGNVDLILRDVQAMMDFHKQGVDSLEYFSKKYGAVEADQRKKFINTMFGLLNKKEQAVLNPMLLEDGVKSRDNVYRTYRADRVSKAIPMAPEEYAAMPFSYEAVSAVRMPEQRQMPEVEAPATSPTRFMPEGVDEDKFYSQLDRVITDKVPSRATPQQIMATIDPTRGSGVKAEEIKWSGIEQALASLEKDGKVSKEELLNYLRNEGRVRFEEVVRSQPTEAAQVEPKLPPNVRVEEIDGEWYITNPVEDEGPFATEEEATTRMMDPNAGYLTTEPAVIGQNQFDPTQYAQYQLPGGENYREVVLAMPDPKKEIALLQSEYQKIRSGQRGPITSEMSNRLTEINARRNKLESELNSTYTSPHFRDIPNYVAHMRTNERVDADGRPGLFVEEFQSDRHQEGRKKGYTPTESEKISASNKIKELRKQQQSLDVGSDEYLAIEAQIPELAKITRTDSSGTIADAPFRTTWPLQLFKRALRDAVDSGKEWVGWTTGETQAERFDLSKQIGKVVWNEDTKMLTAYDPSQQRTVIQESNITADKLEDYVGKEVAKKLVDQSPDDDMDRSLAGLDLRVGGEGMKAFYDNMLPKEIGKYVKPFGGKVEKGKIRYIKTFEDTYGTGQNTGYASSPIWKVSITPEMRQLAQGQMRFMPEPANPAAPNVPFKKPLSRTDAIPDIDSTLINDAVDVNGFAFDRPAKVYMQHPNGERLYFNYDPAYLIKPEFKDLRKTLEGKNVIILEADRMRATGGDMGGPLHPFLRSNQVVVKGPDGKMYKAIWANMTSTFVTGTKNRWFNDDAQYALIHIMDENAHASNKRIARAINEAWKKANLSEYDQRVIAIAMQAAITSQEQSMLSTKITQANSKIKSGDLTDKQIKEYEKYIAGWLKERNSLAWTGINKDISSKISKIKTAQTRFQNKNGTKDSVDKAKANLKEYLAAKPEHLAAFNELSNKSSSFEIADNIGKTFQSRGAAIKGLLGIEAGKFNASDILSKTEDFKGGENMDIVGAVQLSKNKDIFAVYFGNDPKEEAAMSDSERQVRDKLRADPSFVEHEAFDWMMLGPENSDNFIAESSLKPEELLPEYRSKHPKASVKDGSEETVLGAMKKNAEIPLSVKKYTPAQIKQIQKNRKAWIEDRKAKEARKKQVQSLKAKIKQRDASITKLDKMLSVANEAEASAIVAKQSKAESEKKELADQIKTLQNLK